MKIKIYLASYILLLFSFSLSAQINEEFQSEDSISQTKQERFLIPINIYKNLVNKVRKEKIVKDLNLSLINHRGGIDFYEVNGTGVGMRFNGQKVSEISFRKFGEEGLNYESTLRKYGFLQTNKHRTSSLEIEPDFEAHSFEGEIRVYKKGPIICKVYDGTYIGFNFYNVLD